MDEAFIQKLTGIVEDNLTNEQFGIQDLARKAGISRSQLHRKLKKLTKKTGSQFVREIRLEHAMEMLKADVATASEIAYRVGFSSPAYFSKCFHDYYGFPPGEAKERTLEMESDTALLQDQQTTKRIEKEREQPQRFGKLWLPVFATVVVFLFAFYYLYQNISWAPANDQPSIAVLPLDNLTGDPEQEYFVDGIHDALIGGLGKIRSLRVISRTSTLQFRNANANISEIAQQLGVNNILEGSVFLAEDSIRIQLQLINPHPEFEDHLWSEVYNRDLVHVIDVLNEITQKVASEIHVTLSPAEQTRLNREASINPESYKAYLKGMFHWDKLTEQDLNTAMRYFQIALESDSNYALGHAGIASVWVGRLQQGLVPYAEAAPKAKAAAFKALELDSTLSEVHSMLGAISCWVEWEYEKAESHYRKAIALNPNNSEARIYLSHVLNIRHKPEEAMVQADLALELDPFNPLYQSLYGMDMMFFRQFDKAIKLLGSTLEDAPSERVGLSTLRTAYHMKGMYPEALQVWVRSYEVRDDLWAVEALERGNKLGGYQGALEELAETLIARSDTTYVTPWQVATLYTRAGNTDKAITWLKKAYDAHDSNMPYISIDPIFDIMRDDPRFVSLLEQMELPISPPPGSVL